MNLNGFHVRQAFLQHAVECCRTSPRYTSVIWNNGLRWQNPPTPSAVERERTNRLRPSLNPAIPGRIHVLPSLFPPLTPAQPGRIHDLLKSKKSRKWPHFDTNGTPEALDERNPYSLTRRSHWEGSRTLEKAPDPKN